MTKPVYLIQPNYHSVFQGKINYWLPYTVGILWSYAYQNDSVKQHYHLENIIFSRQNIEKFVKHTKTNGIYVFSNYVWNWQYNLALAGAVKKVNPNSTIIFGGPQVTKRPIENSFFKKYPFIDSIIIGEGETAFTQLLVDLSDNNLQKVYWSQRLEDLDIPSPYLTGVFDKIIEENPQVIWNTVIETNRGCPFSCTFCDWGSLVYTKIKKFPLERVQAELRWISDHHIDYLTFADANFGIFKDRDYSIIETLCDVKQHKGFPRNINLCYTKNQTDSIIDIVKLLGTSGLNRGLTISFQSLDSHVLENIKRVNMDINKIESLLSSLESQQLSYYTELILGLPGETLESWKQGHIKLLNIGQHQCLDVFHTMILENSELNDPVYKQKFNINSVSVQNFMHFNTEIDDDIIETLNIVRSTSTMSADDLVNAFMYSWMIVNFHSYGWTQIYSRFLHQTGVSYQSFYDQLLNELKSNQLKELSAAYHTTKEQLELYLDNNQKFIEQKLNSDILRNSQQYFHQNKQLVEELIKNFVTKYYVVLDNLITYQQHFVSTYTQNYPYEISLDIGIQKTLLGEQYTPDIKTCRLELSTDFIDQKDFLVKLVTWRRNHWGKTFIKH